MSRDAKQPVFTQREIVAALKRAGFKVVRVKSTHCFLKRPGSRTVCVPGEGGRRLPKGTFGRILRQSGLSMEEFAELRKG